MEPVVVMDTLHAFYRSLGQTGIRVSPIGLGTVKLGRDQGVKYPENFSIPIDNQVVDLLSLAKELGINTLDTAPAYGHSEERLGKLLSLRHDWVIIGKAGEEFINGRSIFDFSAKAVVSSVERSLARLKTDYMDVLLIHSDGQDKDIVDDLSLWDSLEQLKTRGLIRSYGLSGKTVDPAIEALARSDCAMVTYNLNEQKEKPVLAYAQQSHKGILVKKALASGHVCSDGQTSSLVSSFNLVFSEPAVSSVIIGTINPSHLIENIKTVVTCLEAD